MTPPLAGVGLILVQMARIRLHHFTIAQEQEPHLIRRHLADKRLSFVER